MQVKLYQAADVATAMDCIRRELGPDALILGTRRIADGIEVTAAIEREEPPDDGSDRASDAAEAETPPDDGRREAALAWHGVTPREAEKLIAGPLPLALAHAYRFTLLDVAIGARPIMVVGPPGAGKTLTIARLATRLVLAGAAPLVVTADGKRAGATQQLAAFTRLLGLNLLVASTPASLGRALARRADGAPVLIDTPGIDIFEPAQAAEIAALQAATSAAVAVVLPAGLDVAEAAELAEAYRTRDASMLVATRLDVARRLGGTLAAAGSGLAFTEAGIGPGAADGLVPLTPELLATRLLATPVFTTPDRTA